MCVHYLAPSPSMLEDYARGRRSFSGAYQEIFPGRKASVFYLADGELRQRELLWGFPVDWSKSPVVNTRLESGLEGRKMWQEIFTEGRLLLPALGFYEPHRREMVPSPRSARPIKQQYLFDRGGEMFFMAAISDGKYFSLVTTPPSPQVARVHDRMPLVLEEDELKIWLGGEGEYFLNRDKTEFEVKARYPSPAFFDL